ncbi:DJ-1/PfpI family protein [Williamsia muralis]|uniref:Glutamine amidotransferase n=1 Tax=Williamsia marianensis TaxID=85044 RepID=A0A2G3PLY1_WILMA|nr:DJ-1/PfpI family protein [Williamsia marianensis]PHV66835.1 glutamine amidotransferase [Williamsia marianensis]
MTQIALVVYPGFTALDVVGPYEVFRMLPDADVRFVWHEAGPVVADSGVLILGATHTLDETPSPDVVLVPGGNASVMNQARDGQLLQWLRSVHTSSTWTTSVCAGSVVLAAAGVLDGQRATSHWQTLSALKLFGVTPVGDQRIVHEGKIATSAGVSAGIDLALWVAAQIADEKRARAIQLAIEYDPQPPFDSGHQDKADLGTKALATAILAKESLNKAQISAASKLLWEQVISAARVKMSRHQNRQ